MSVVLGIDGGGTHTRASIMDGDRVLAHAESGSIKRLRVGAEVAEDNLRALLKDVYAQAGVTAFNAAQSAWPAPPCPACRSGSPRSSATLPSRAPRWWATK